MNLLRKKEKKCVNYLFAHLFCFQHSNTKTVEVDL